MSDERNLQYAERLSTLIKKETISEFYQKDKTKFYEFRNLLKEIFPTVFSKCELLDFDGSFVLIWQGENKNSSPIVFMNHHDVVEAPGEWKYPAFSGEIAEEKLWGRGTLDTKGGLFCMLEAAEELMVGGFTPKTDIYFVSACTEETDGTGCDNITKYFLEKGIKFSFCLDEGGMILYDPIGGADGYFAMVGVGEKGTADIKFKALSTGGHASTPPKDTPLVRLGKFMAEVDSNSPFETYLSPTIAEMLKRLSVKMKNPLKTVMGNADGFRPILEKIMPSFSGTANALLRTTIAFTMASGSASTNVIPEEAFVMGNMRFSHHEGRDESINKLQKIADKYNIEIEVTDPGFTSPISPFDCDEFRLIESAVSKSFPNVLTSPYIMTGASDARFMSRVCDKCYRFVPFVISDEQLSSIHGLNECVDIKNLAPAVDFYKYLMENLK